MYSLIIKECTIVVFTFARFFLLFKHLHESYWRHSSRYSNIICCMFSKVIGERVYLFCIAYINLKEL